jgi:hypothetical protein
MLHTTFAWLFAAHRRDARNTVISSVNTYDFRGVHYNTGINFSGSRYGWIDGGM